MDFWEDGFWADGFWEDGFWATEESEPLPVPDPPSYIEVEADGRHIEAGTSGRFIS